MIKEFEILKCIKEADAKNGFLPKSIHLMEGMSTIKTRLLFNKLGSLLPSGSNYLEVGCWKGATFCSTLYNNAINGIAIDSFSQFQEQNIYHYEHQKGNSKTICLKNLTELTLWNPVDQKNMLLHSDAFSTDLKVLPKIDFYFYDGDHSEEAQYNAYKYFNPTLSNEFLTVVDDWCDGKDTAERGTRRAFKDLGYKIKFETSLPASKNCMDPEGWWNGLYIALVEKP